MPSSIYNEKFKLVCKFKISMHPTIKLTRKKRTLYTHCTYGNQVTSSTNACKTPTKPTQKKGGEGELRQKKKESGNIFT